MAICAKDSLLLNGRETGAIKSGIMYYKSPRIRVQAWPAGSVKQYWCELHRESSYHPRQLVLVETSKSIQEDIETIPLENIFKITQNEGLIKGKSIFQIITSDGKFTLGTDSLEKTASWINALNEELFGPPKHNVVYQYRVMVKKSYEEDLPYGDYLLKVYDKEIRLFTPNGLIATKFKCSMEDIHKVRYHLNGLEECCVTISIKNTQTNNKEVGILLLSTKSAAEVKKVISYRKKHLISQDELDGETASLDEDSSVLVKPLKIVSKHQKAVCHDGPSTEEENLSSINKDVVCNNDMASKSLPKEWPILYQGSRLLPQIYNAMTNPSIDDGVLRSDSFDLGAPKRQKAIKLKERSLPPSRESISDRPPAVLPKNTKISNYNHQDHVTLDLNTFSSSERPTSGMYHYVESKFNMSSKVKHLPMQGMDSKNNDHDKGYIIDSITETYLQVIHGEEEDKFAFMPDNFRKN